MGGRATWRPPEASRATRAPMPVDPMAYRTAPGDPGTSGRATRWPLEPRRVNRAAVPVDPPRPEKGHGDLKGS
jgi:hypothetical protein